MRIGYCIEGKGSMVTFCVFRTVNDSKIWTDLIFVSLLWSLILTLALPFYDMDTPVVSHSQLPHSPTQKLKHWPLSLVTT